MLPILSLPTSQVKRNMELELEAVRTLQEQGVPIRCHEYRESRSYCGGLENSKVVQRQAK